MTSRDSRPSDSIGRGCPASCGRRGGPGRGKGSTTSVTVLRDAGVAVGLGADGIRDLWSPYGTGDLLALTTQVLV